MLIKKTNHEAKKSKQYLKKETAKLTLGRFYI